MKNVYMLLIYVPMAITMAVMAFFLLRKKNRSPLDVNMLLMILALFGWQLMLIIYNLSTSLTVARIMYDMDLPFVALAVIAYFLFIVRFYGVDSYFPPEVVACLFVIPAFTAVISATSSRHDLLRSYVEILETTPAHVVEAGRGPWFWVHTGYCYILIMAALVLCVVQHWKLPRIYRAPSLLLLIGMSASAAANVFVLFGNAPFDLSLAAITLASILLYFASKRNRGILFVRQARREVFHYLNQAIFILDDDEEIISANRPAERMLSASGLRDWENRRFDEVFTNVLGDVERYEVLEDEESGIDYYQKQGTVINMRHRPMLDRRGGVIGNMVTLVDATENRRLIQRLEDVAGIDVLTGLINRNEIYRIKEELDSEKHLPISIIIGDLNNLKKVNDTLGHPQGDLLLRVSAEILETYCPPSAHVARIGGDEFMVLLPNFSRGQAEELISALKGALAGMDRFAFVPSMALGAATKSDVNERMEDIIEKADAAMYQDKVMTKAREMNKESNALPGSLLFRRTEETGSRFGAEGE